MVTHSGHSEKKWRLVVKTAEVKSWAEAGPSLSPSGCLVFLLWGICFSLYGSSACLLLLMGPSSALS